MIILLRGLCPPPGGVLRSSADLLDNMSGISVAVFLTEFSSSAKLTTHHRSRVTERAEVGRLTSVAGDFGLWVRGGRETDPTGGPKTGEKRALLWVRMQILENRILIC